MGGLRLATRGLCGPGKIKYLAPFAHGPAEVEEVTWDLGFAHTEDQTTMALSWNTKRWPKNSAERMREMT